MDCKQTWDLKWGSQHCKTLKVLQEKRDDVFKCGVSVTRCWQLGWHLWEKSSSCPALGTARSTIDVPWDINQTGGTDGKRKGRKSWTGRKGTKNSVRNSPVSSKGRGGGRGGAPDAGAACGADTHTAAMEDPVVEQRDGTWRNWVFLKVYPQGLGLWEGPTLELGKTVRSMEQQWGVIMEWPQPAFSNPPI